MEQKWLKSVIACLMLGVFLTPNMLPAFHALLDHDHHDHHDHEICQAKDTFHWHDDQLECELCDYAIGLKPIISDDQEFQSVLNTLKFDFIPRADVYLSNRYLTPSLRAPPIA